MIHINLVAVYHVWKANFTVITNPNYVISRIYEAQKDIE